MTWNRFAAVTTVAALLLPVTSVYGSQATEQLLMKARSLEGRGLLELAARSWDQVLLAEPNNVEALTGLARYAQTSGKQADAAKYLERLRRIDAANPDIARIAAMKPLTEQRGLLQEAQKLAQKQDFEGAMRAYRQVFGNNPPPGGWAISYFETQAAAPGGWDDAVAGLKRYVKMYPESPEYPLALAKLLTYRQKTRAEGMQMLEDMKGAPTDVEKARLIWRQALLWDAGNPASLPALRAYLARYPDAELAKLLNRTTAAAASAARTEPNRPPQSPKEGEGYRALNSSKLKEAESDFSAALKATPHSATASAGLGFVKLKQQDFDGAIPLFEQALLAHPTDKSISSALAVARFWSHMKRGGEALNASRTSVAVEEFKQALAIRPQSTDAIRALAGSYVQQKQPSLAAPLYRHLLKADPRDVDSWLALMNALSASGNPGAAVAVMGQMPAGVRTELLSRPSQLISIAGFYAENGDFAEARRLQELAGRSLHRQEGQPSTDIEMQLAGLYSKLNEPRKAADLFESITKSQPANIDAWEGLLGSLVQAGDFDRASSTIQRMPPEPYQQALKKPGFLRAAARVETSIQRLDVAERLLRRAAELDRRGGKEPDAGNDLQLADVLVHESKEQEAEAILRRAITAAPDLPGPRLTLISLLEQRKRYTAALSEIQLMPQRPFSALEADPAFIGVEARIYSQLNQPGNALKVLRRGVSNIETQGRVVPVDLRVQEAWLLVNQPGQEQDLYRILARYTNSREATAAQRASLTSIWSIWVRRRAAAEIANGNLVQAVAILKTASQLLSNDAAVQGSLAGAYLQGKDMASAFAVYKRWGLSEATSDDFSGAVGSALAANDTTLATRWLARGLQKFPRDSRLLSLAGKQAAARGEYEKARLYLREALANLPADEAQSGGAGLSYSTSAASPQGGLEKSLGALLLERSPADVPEISESALSIHRDPVRDNDRLAADITSPATMQYAAANDPEPPAAARNSSEDGASARSSLDSLSTDIERESNRLVAGNLRRQTDESQQDSQFSTPQADTLLQTDRSTAGPEVAAPDQNINSTQAAVSGAGFPALGQASMLVDPALPGDKAPAAAPSLHDDIQNDLASIDGRNTPFFTDGASVQSRSGRGGVDKLTIEQADIGASTTIGNAVRLSLIAHPTYIDSGNPAGATTPGFGSVIANGYSTSPTAFGIAAEGQVSTRDFGLRLGLTPYNFAVRNWLGGLRFTPGGGPFTILISRDTMMDTKLSFAGERDAGTGLVWGGVMANSATVLGHWGTDKSGFYASAGYQNITGKSVESNSQLNVTTGTYFKLLTTPQGSLTAGLNLTGMHYDKNLSYFTLGQGGYFSPQQYFLANVPLRWVGSWNRKLQYSISGSLGVQHFFEDASPYFPLLSSNTNYYAAFANTGGNYNLDFRMIYQIAPQWLAGAYLNAGNARDYRNVSSGIFLRYLFEPRPFSADINTPSVPDWKGAQPFGIPPGN